MTELVDYLIPGIILGSPSLHDDVIKWKHFPRYWPFLRGIHRYPVNSPNKDQWRGALMFSLICVWLNGGVKREAGDLRRYSAHYDVTIMTITNLCYNCCIYVFCKWMMKWYWLGKLLGIQSIYILRTNQGFDYFKSRFLHATGCIPGDGRLIYMYVNIQFAPICAWRKIVQYDITTLLPRFCTALQISICYSVLTSQH